MRQGEKDFILGVAAALAEIHRMHGCEVEVDDVMKGMGLTLADLKSAGVEAYDLRVLSKIVSPVSSPAQDARS